MIHQDKQNSAAVLAFHGSLKDFLAPVNRTAGVVIYPVTRRASVKDVIEALGPPHSCIGSLLVNGGAADFGHLLQAGDRVAAHPLERPRKVLEPTYLRPDPLPSLRFVADANVGKLAQHLRLLGFDTAFDRNLDDAEVAELAHAEGRVVLSKDRGLLKRSRIVYAHLVRNEDPQEQVLEVLRTFGLRPPFNQAFTRCSRCNGLLEPVAKEDVLHLLEPKTRKYFHEFRQCPDCKQVYWAGSHQELFRKRLESLATNLF